MKDFATKVARSLAILSGTLVAANAQAAATTLNARLNVNGLSTDPGTGTATDKFQFGVQVQI